MNFYTKCKSNVLQQDEKEKNVKVFLGNLGWKIFFVVQYM